MFLQIEPLDKIKEFKKQFGYQCESLNTLMVGELDKLHESTFNKNSELLNQKFKVEEIFGHIGYLKQALELEYVEKRNSIISKVQSKNESILSTCLEDLMKMLNDKNDDIVQDEQVVIPEKIDEIVPPPTKYDDKEDKKLKDEFKDIKVYKTHLR